MLGKPDLLHHHEWKNFMRWSSPTLRLPCSPTLPYYYPPSLPYQLLPGANECFQLALLLPPAPDFGRDSAVADAVGAAELKNIYNILYVIL